MPLALLFEGKINGQWKTLGVQRQNDPPATISNNRADRREIYVTQCFADHATISRLPGGVDIEQGLHRIIDSEELQHAVVLRRLGIGENIKLMVKPDRGPLRPVRYRCVMMGPGNL